MLTKPAPTIPVASSLDAITPSRIRELADVAFGMEGVLKLQFGESNLPTPQFIKDALAQAVADGYTYYTENGGLPSLRAALAEKVAALHGVALDPAGEILVTASGVQALNVAIRCTLNPGDEAIVLTPNWPNGSEIVKLYGATPVEIPYAYDGERFTPDLAAMEAAVTPRTRLLLYTSPSNPLGWVATVAEQQALLAFARRHGLWLLADEVYERLYYEGPVAPSILRLCSREDAVIVVQSFSKSYCMTGWRLGWVVSRRDLVRKATQLNEFIVSHAPSMIQRAGEAALRQGEDAIAGLVEQLHENMAFCAGALRSVRGISLPKPQGAFYLYPRIHGLEDSFGFALALLQEEKVAVAPGSAFGAGGEGSVRICFASERAVLEPAMERFCRFVERYDA
ncbi:MAG TPA: pyridoxal phosphate-dependent aminotransferase [Caldilineaceae bacterium]|nr:pyridoxal phosphate-dependent aminotransferase [Caldilineaceae bacterium]